MNYAGLVVLVVATVAGICSCQQKCTLPANEDLQDVIINIFQADDSSRTTNVNVFFLIKGVDTLHYLRLL